jgi:hypothetical protein
MNIYFSCSITGGRDDQSVYEAIVRHLLSQGHDVPTAHLSSASVMDEEAVIEPRDVYLRDSKWVEECDALIAEVSTPSHGVGYEIALALLLGKPVFCCYQEGRKISKMILGNDHPTLSIKPYKSVYDLLLSVDEFIISTYF